MTQSLRFLMLAALVVWLGGIVFFGAVVAPTLFSVLPSRHLAGTVVVEALTRLHFMGMAAGALFAACSMIHGRLTAGYARPFAVRHLLIYAMLVLTLVSQFLLMPKMKVLRAAMVEIDRVPADDPRRVEFNRLHRQSTQIEGAVLLLGAGVIMSLARVRPR
ncbi:MAG TPA: DUF4149 domain-containing protein [Terriglobales bacterium]|nr:DUF4149 domain-containing protein [Terriglobales bacterium]